MEENTLQKKMKNLNFMNKNNNKKERNLKKEEIRKKAFSLCLSLLYTSSTMVNDQDIFYKYGFTVHTLQTKKKQNWFLTLNCSIHFTWARLHEWTDFFMQWITTTFSLLWHRQRKNKERNNKKWRKKIELNSIKPLIHRNFTCCSCCTEKINPHKFSCWPSKAHHKYHA